MKRRIPLWALAEFAEWMESGRTGLLEYQFSAGRPVLVKRGEVVTPADSADGEAICPQCNGPLVNERNHGSVFDCPACERAWTIFDIRKIRRRAA